MINYARDKNIVSVTANYMADTMQSELLKKTIWSNVSIVSYNIPLLATLSIFENITLPLQYFENIKRKDAETVDLVNEVSGKWLPCRKETPRL